MFDVLKWVDRTVSAGMIVDVKAKVSLSVPIIYEISI